MKVFSLIIMLFLPCILFARESVDRLVLEKYVKKMEVTLNIPSRVLHALILIESNYEPKATNYKDLKRGVAVSSFGMGQLTEDTAKNLCGLVKEELYDPYKNLKCAAKVIKYQLTRFKSIPKAVSAYNAGTPCICDGKFYTRNLGAREETCYTRKKGKSLKATCDIKEKDKFLNQYYVDKFLGLWK